MKNSLEILNSCTPRHMNKLHHAEFGNKISEISAENIRGIRGMTLLQYFGIQANRKKQQQNDISEADNETDSLLQYDEQTISINKLSPKKLGNKTQKYKTQQYQLDTQNKYKSNYIKSPIKYQATQNNFRLKQKQKAAKVIYIRQNHVFKMNSPLRNNIKYNSLQNRHQNASNSITTTHKNKLELQKIRRETKNIYDNSKKMNLQFKNAFMITKCQFRYKKIFNKVT